MRLLSAVKWTFVAVGARYALKLLGNLTLVRLLPAEAFGLSAIVLAVINGVEAITDVGTRAALISSRRTDPEWLDTAWTLGIVRGVAIGVCVALAAVPLAAFYEDQRLVAMIAATGLMSVLIGLTSNEAFLAIRNLEAKALAAVELTSAVGGYLVMLVWAWYYPSAWSLLAGAVVTTGIFAGFSYFAFDRRPHRFTLNRQAMQELVKFGKWVLLASLLGFFILQGDRFIIGKAIGLAGLGIYTIAVTWASSLQALCGMFLSRLYLPVIAGFRRTMDDPEAPLTTLRRSILALLVIPFAFAAGCSDQLISLLYPASYAAAGPIMGILVVGAWFALLEQLYNDQLLAAGTPAWRFIAQTASIAVMAGGLVVIARDFSLSGIAAVFVSGSAVRALILMVRAHGARIQPICSDLLMTGAFLTLAAALSAVAGMLALRESAVVAMAVSFAVLAPFGAAVLWFAMKRILALAPS